MYLTYFLFFSINPSFLGTLVFLSFFGGGRGDFLFGCFFWGGTLGTSRQADFEMEKTQQTADFIDFDMEKKNNRFQNNVQP